MCGMVPHHSSKAALVLLIAPGARLQPVLPSSHPLCSPHVQGCWLRLLHGLAACSTHSVSPLTLTSHLAGLALLPLGCA